MTNEEPLLRIKGAPAPPGQELALRAERKLRRQKAEVPTTSDTGENAGDLIGAWVVWYQNGAGVPVPETLVARLGKQVKSLISMGFTSVEIKFGLGFWAMSELDNPRLSPLELDRYVWRYARDTRAQAQAWRNEMKERMKQFGITTGPQTAKERRESETAQVLQNWTRKEKNPWA